MNNRDDARGSRAPRGRRDDRREGRGGDFRGNNSRREGGFRSDRDRGERRGGGEGRSFGGERREFGGERREFRDFNRDAWGNRERSGDARSERSDDRRSFDRRGSSEGRGGFGNRSGGFRSDRDRGERRGGGEGRSFGGGFSRGGDRGPRRTSRDDFRGPRPRRDDRGDSFGHSERDEFSKPRSAIRPVVILPENTILVMGRNCIEEILSNAPDRLKKVYVGTDHGDARLQGLIEKFTELQVEVQTLDRAAINKLCDSDSHQGIAAAVSDRVYLDLDQYLDRLTEGQPCKLLMLDSISDPQNFGAILRAVECFGVDAVIWSRNRSSGITATVSKVSVGASELVNLIPVNNLADAVTKLKAKGFWVYASTLNEDAKPLSEMKFDNRSAIIVGSEGKGIQELLLKESDFRFFIPQKGKIQSLNVSQATAVILAKLADQAIA